MSRGALMHGRGEPGEMIVIRDAVGRNKRVIAGRDGRFAVRLKPGRYTFRHNDGTRELEVDSAESGTWGPFQRCDSEVHRRRGFIIAAADPVWPGGAERWMLHMAGIKDPPCLGVVFAHSGHPAQGGEKLLDKLVGVAPVYHGLYELKNQVDTAEVVVDWRCDPLRSVLPAERHRRPRIVRVSHSPEEDEGAVAAHRNAASYVDRWVAVSASAARCIGESVKPDRVRIIRNAIDVESLRQSMPDNPGVVKREDFGIDPCCAVAVMLCRLSPEKRPEFALDLARELPSHWRVILAGDGMEYDRIAGMVMRDSLLREKVVMPGVVSASTAIGVADVVVVASRYESFNYTIAEAWALFKPVASTPVGLAAMHPDWVIPIDRNAGRAAAADLAWKLDFHGDNRAKTDWTYRWPGVERQERWVRANLGIEKFRSEWSTLLLEECAMATSGRNT